MNKYLIKGIASISFGILLLALFIHLARIAINRMYELQKQGKKFHWSAGLEMMLLVGGMWVIMYGIFELSLWWEERKKSELH